MQINILFSLIFAGLMTAIMSGCVTSVNSVDGLSAPQFEQAKSTLKRNCRVINRSRSVGAFSYNSELTVFSGKRVRENWFKFDTGMGGIRDALFYNVETQEVLCGGHFEKSIMRDRGNNWCSIDRQNRKLC